MLKRNLLLMLVFFVIGGCSGVKGSSKYNKTLFESYSFNSDGMGEDSLSSFQNKRLVVPESFSLVSPADGDYSDEYLFDNDGGLGIKVSSILLGSYQEVASFQDYSYRPFVYSNRDNYTSISPENNSNVSESELIFSENSLLDKNSPFSDLIVAQEDKKPVIKTKKKINNYVEPRKFTLSYNPHKELSSSQKEFLEYINSHLPENDGSQYTKSLKTELAIDKREKRKQFYISLLKELNLGNNKDEYLFYKLGIMKANIEHYIVDSVEENKRIVALLNEKKQINGANVPIISKGTGIVSNLGYTFKTKN